MVEQVRAAWETWTVGRKLAAGLGAILLLMGTTALKLSGYVGLPEKTAANTEAIRALEASVEESRRFSNCWMLEFGAGKDPNVCRYLLADPDEFRPPYTPAVP